MSDDLPDAADAEIKAQWDDMDEATAPCIDPSIVGDLLIGEDRKSTRLNSSH